MTMRAGAGFLPGALLSGAGFSPVKDEKVTIAGAREHYGVVIDPQSLHVDWEKMARLRQRHQESERLGAAD